MDDLHAVDCEAFKLRNRAVFRDVQLITQAVALDNGNRSAFRAPLNTEDLLRNTESFDPALLQFDPREVTLAAMARPAMTAFGRSRRLQNQT